MKKLTLLFRSLSELTQFSKSLSGGFLLNTKNFTITGTFPEIQINLALELYNAVVIETTDKVFSYDLI